MDNKKALKTVNRDAEQEKKIQRRMKESETWGSFSVQECVNMWRKENHYV